MAIDTQNKRRSTLDTKSVLRILPVPDGTIGAVDRAHLWIYSGIAIAAAAATAGGIKPVRVVQQIGPLANVS